MVKYSQKQLDIVFSALSDQTRRGILERLALGDCAVTELAEPFQMSLPAIWKHLRVLEDAGLIHCEKTGRIKRCALEAAPMAEAVQWLERYRIFWEGRMDALEAFLQQQMNK
jgi:DNA-binding transcriptional ArsR family regulator